MKLLLFADNLIFYTEKSRIKNIKIYKRVEQICQIQDHLIKISSTFGHLKMKK